MTQMERMVSKSEHTHVGSLGPQLPAILKAFQIINSVTFLYVTCSNFYLFAASETARKEC